MTLAPDCSLLIPPVLTGKGPRPNARAACSHWQALQRRRADMPLRTGLPMIRMIAGRLGCSFRHVAAPLRISVISIALAVVDAEARVDPHLTIAEQAKPAGGASRQVPAGLLPE